MYFDRNATKNGAKRSGSGGMHRRPNAAWVLPQAVKHLDGKLWELRVRADEGIARGIYVTVAERRVVVLHVFVKKTRKTPLRALATAKERMKQVMP